MPMQQVVAAVEARLASGWTLCPFRRFADDNGDTPADASAFLTVQYPVAMSDQITVGAPGANVFREEGAFRLVLAMPRTMEGRLLALIWTDELAKLFRGKQFGA
ncbi:MAG TPA: phage tail terminator-like protein, partial [Kaistia sp.]|nr:phage tail terminator-like protein [Kaistia sp.]